MSHRVAEQWLPREVAFEQWATSPGSRRIRDCSCHPAEMQSLERVWCDSTVVVLSRKLEAKARNRETGEDMAEQSHRFRDGLLMLFLRSSSGIGKLRYRLQMCPFRRTQEPIMSRNTTWNKLKLFQRLKSRRRCWKRSSRCLKSGSWSTTWTKLSTSPRAGEVVKLIRSTGQDAESFFGCAFATDSSLYHQSVFPSASLSKPTTFPYLRFGSQVCRSGEGHP